MGSECSGDIEAVGEGVENFKVRKGQFFNIFIPRKYLGELKRKEKRNDRENFPSRNYEFRSRQPFFFRVSSELVIEC